MTVSVPAAAAFFVIAYIASLRWAFPRPDRRRRRASTSFASGEQQSSRLPADCCSAGATHEHKWELATSTDGSVFVIDSYPQQYPYRCKCGAFTHVPETGEPCKTCAPDDWSRRTNDLVTLRGGHFDGETIPRPANKTLNLRVDPVDEREQLFDHYRQTDDDRDIFDFHWNGWTQPLVSRSESGT